MQHTPSGDSTHRSVPPLKVTLDTSFAGINLTGVGKYSRRLVESEAALAGKRRLDLSCFGPTCSPERRHILGGLYQEWPSYTQIFLPLALLAKRPAIVHSTSHLGPLCGPGKLIVTVHDVIFRRYPQDYNPYWLKITGTLLPHVVRRASAIIADSDTTRRDLERFYPGSRGKTRVVYPGVDYTFRRLESSTRTAAIRRKYGLSEEPYIICLGPWVRRKSLDVVVKAFAMLADELPGLHLVITGRPAAGMESGATAAALERLPGPTRARVNSVGYVQWDDVAPLVRGARLLAYPSLYEGFGLPPLEAMAVGVPAVVRDTPAVVEATGDAALVVGSGDPADWAAAMRRVLTDRAEEERLRREGLARSAQFTWSECANRTIDLYYEVAGDGHESHKER